MSTSPIVTIADIAEVRMGVTLRGRDATRPDPHGSCLMIRISDLSDDGALINDNLLRFEPGEDIRPELFLRQGDVLLPNRGTRTTAHMYALPLNQVIVGLQFYILRSNVAKVHPAYLAWFLRTEKAAAHFASLRKGTLVQAVQRQDVLALTLPLPSLAKQQTIISLDALAIQERQLSSELAQKKAHYFQRLMLHAASS